MQQNKTTTRTIPRNTPRKTLNAEHVKILAKALVTETNKGKAPRTKQYTQDVGYLFFSWIESTGKDVKVDQTWHDFLNQYDGNTHNGFLMRLKVIRKVMRLRKLDRTQRKVDPREPLDLDYTAAEYEKLLKVTTNDRDRNIIYVFRYGGLRAIELLSLTKNCFDVHDDYIELSFFCQKTRKWAKITLQEPTAELTRYLESLDNDVIWPSLQRGHGEPLNYPALYKKIKSLSKKAGVDFHPHLFRHYLATELGRDGDTREDLNNQFNWSGRGNTAAVYVNLSNEETMKKHRRRVGIEPEKDVKVGIVKCRRCHAVIMPGVTHCAVCKLAVNPKEARIELTEANELRERVAQLEGQLAERQAELDTTYQKVNDVIKNVQSGAINNMIQDAKKMVTDLVNEQMKNLENLALKVDK